MGEKKTSPSRTEEAVQWMGGRCKAVSLKGAVVCLVAALLAALLFTSPPMDAVAFSLPRPVPLPSDNRLSSASLLLNNEVFGAESLAEDPRTGRIYAGLRTGLIVEIELEEEGTRGRIVRAVRLTNATDCDGSYTSFLKCGRPLGMRFTEDGSLLVADAYLGLFEIDVDKEKVFTLVRGGRSIDGSADAPPMRSLNDVDVLPDGRIVLTESSTRFDDRDYLYDMLEHRPNGRVLVYDRKSDTLKELLVDLFFPNGVAVVKGKVLIAEMGMARLLSFSPSSKKVSVLKDNLPGYPDGLRKSVNGRSLWVAIPSLRSPSDNFLALRPRLRNVIAQLLPYWALEWIVKSLSPSHGLLLHISEDQNGLAVESWQDASGRVSDISTVIETKSGQLLMGSDANYYIASLPYRRSEKV